MTNTLRRSCRPLTYLLAFLLLPIVLIVSTSNSATAAVVAVGETVTVQAETRSAFPGEDVRCTFTGYTRLHDTGLYSVRATVRCDWSFGNWGLDSMTLVARNSDSSSTNLCRFSGRFGITKKTDTSATLVGNLQVAGPPPAGCILTTGDAYLHDGTDEDGDDNTQATIEGFGWNLGALPVAPVADPTGPCDAVSVTSVEATLYPNKSGPGNTNNNFFYIDFFPHWTWKAGAGDIIAPDGLPLSQSTWELRTAWNLVYRASTDGKYYATFNSGSQELDKNRRAWTPTDGGGQRAYIAVASSSGGTVMTLQGAQLYLHWRKSTTTAGYGGPLGVWNQPASLSNAAIAGIDANGTTGLTRPATCWVWYGEKIAIDQNSTEDDPAGALNAAPTSPAVDEPEELPTGDDSDLEDGSCAGFSFTDPASWAGAGICVLVKAVRALFSVMTDVLGVLSGMVTGIVSGILNGLAALFVPSDESLEDMRDALDFTDHQNLTGWTDTLTTQGLLGQGGAEPAAREVGAMETAGTPSIVPGVILTGSCQGPGIAADKLAVLGYEGTLHPFDACGGTMATVAQWTRLLLMMFVGLSAALKVFQMLAVGVGAARSATILGSFDWSEATRR